jgi:hypothetical protein
VTNSKTASNAPFASDREKARTTGGEQASVLKGKRAKQDGTPTYTDADLRKLRRDGTSKSNVDR